MLHRYFAYRDIPPLLLWIWLCLGQLRADSNTIHLYAMIVIIFAQALRVWARQYIGEHSRTRTIEVPELITQGPYSLSRNPLYVSNIIFGFGLVFLTSNKIIESIIIMALFVLHYKILIAIEEPYVKREFRNHYNKWIQTTPRLIGMQFHFSRGVPKRSVQEAIRLDKWTWIFQYAMIAVAIICAI